MISRHTCTQYTPKNACFFTYVLIYTHMNNNEMKTNLNYTERYILREQSKPRFNASGCNLEIWIKGLKPCRYFIPTSVEHT